MPCVPLSIWFSVVFSYRQYGKEEITLRTKGDHRMLELEGNLKMRCAHAVSTYLVFKKCIWDHRTQSPESSTNHTANHSPEIMLAPGSLQAGNPNLTAPKWSTETSSHNSFQWPHCRLEKGFQLCLKKQLFEGQIYFMSANYTASLLLIDKNIQWFFFCFGYS